MLATCWAAQGTAAEWHYEGPHGVEHWGEQFVTCAEGVNQSPVDITETLSAELAPLHIDYQGQVSELVNNGHTIQANVSGQNTLTIEGETFTLKQFHFHTPSENTIQHKHYPLEAHFVHANPQGNLAVIAAMFESGPRGNPALKTLLTRLPKNGDRITLSDALSPVSLLPREREYYRFNGSLTTPPCTEGVRWYVMKEPQASTPAQTSALQEIMGSNARPVQPLNARVVLQ
ncbi:carbonic anhydrase family protein [Photobacterium sp. MCCC 1A19761]